MADIFDEVQEDLRAERAKRLLLRYGGLIAAAAVAVIAVVGGWQAWQLYRTRQDLRTAAQYVMTMNLADATAPGADTRRAAIGAFEGLVAESPEGYRTLSRLRAAALKADSGDIPGATALWDQVAGDNAADPLLRDLASLMWATRQVDSGDPALLTARLRPLAEPSSPWRSLAREQLALLDLRQGRTAEATSEFRKLSQDVTAPAGVRSRTGALLARLGG